MTMDYVSGFIYYTGNKSKYSFMNVPGSIHTYMFISNHLNDATTHITHGIMNLIM